MDFGFDVIDNLKAALVTVFDFCELIITDEFIKESSDKLSLGRTSVCNVGKHYLV